MVVLKVRYPKGEMAFDNEECMPTCQVKEWWNVDWLGAYKSRVGTLKNANLYA